MSQDKIISIPETDEYDIQMEDPAQFLENVYARHSEISSALEKGGVTDWFRAFICTAEFANESPDRRGWIFDQYTALKEVLDSANDNFRPGTRLNLQRYPRNVQQVIQQALNQFLNSKNETNG